MMSVGFEENGGHFWVLGEGDCSVSLSPNFHHESPGCFALALSMNCPDLNNRRGQFVDPIEGLPSLVESIALLQRLSQGRFPRFPVTFDGGLILEREPDERRMFGAGTV
jgi:hypothetical protein